MLLRWHQHPQQGRPRQWSASCPAGSQTHTHREEFNTALTESGLDAGNSLNNLSLSILLVVYKEAYGINKAWALLATMSARTSMSYPCQQSSSSNSTPDQQQSVARMPHASATAHACVLMTALPHANTHKTDRFKAHVLRQCAPAHCTTTPAF